MHTYRSIVYVSTAVLPMSESQLESLMVESRDLNFETQVTGVLLYGSGDFMQCFEGEEESVRVTYDRIRASRRHTGIIELVNETVAARSFEDWHMGFKRARQSELLRLSTAQWRRQAGTGAGSIDAAPGMELLKHFWNRTKG